MGETEIVLGAVGFFFIVGTLLGLSGLAGSTIQIPSGVTSQDGASEQGFVAQTLECLFTLYTACDNTVETQTFSVISDVLGFASSYMFFFFQLVTFQLPIPAFLNAIIVLPAAAALVYVGLRFARGGG